MCVNYVNDFNKIMDRKLEIDSCVFLHLFIFISRACTAFPWPIVPKALYGSECFKAANFGLFKCKCVT